jgi:hypothetical protein
VQLYVARDARRPRCAKRQPAERSKGENQMLQVLSAERQGVQEMSDEGAPRSQGPEAMAQAQEVRGRGYEIGWNGGGGCKFVDPLSLPGVERNRTTHVGRALHVRLFLENLRRVWLIFNRLRYCHCQRVLLGYHYPIAGDMEAKRICASGGSMGNPGRSICDSRWVNRPTHRCSRTGLEAGTCNGPQ